MSAILSFPLDSAQDSEQIIGRFANDGQTVLTLATRVIDAYKISSS